MKKKIIGFVIVFTALVLYSCESVTEVTPKPAEAVKIYDDADTATLPGPFFEQISHENDDDNFSIKDSGTYYSYQFAKSEDRISNPQQLLCSLSDQYVYITDAWYRPHHAGCDRPDQQWITDHEYASKFIIKVDSANEKALNWKFVKVTPPIYIGCGFWTQHYKFHLKYDYKKRD